MSTVPTQPGGQNAGNPYSPPGGGYNQPVVTQPAVTPVVVTTVPAPRNWMVPAVLSCLCCFWPTGIFAIMFASKANTAAAQGNVEEANTNANYARTLIIVSLCVGIQYLCIYRIGTNTNIKI
uniref:Proline-rich transmembrane protein 1 n=1 Tax=Magallana gigas TaxID=29159 RepID=K1QFT1_MAGGI